MAEAGSLSCIESSESSLSTATGKEQKARVVMAAAGCDEQQQRSSQQPPAWRAIVLYL